MTTVERALTAALYTEGDGALDTGASLLAADPTADAELTRRCEEFVRRAWERGWQPADVLRLVRRDLDPHHAQLTAELVTAQLRAYDRLPPRWAAQLAEFSVDPWNAGRFAYATAVLEVLRLLARLPSIEPVGPPPGSPQHLPPSPDEPRELTRIRALLAKAEATGFPEEAEAFSAKAQELMARHSLDEALLAARTQSTEAPAARRIGVDAPYEATKAVLMDAVATANHCRAVWNSDLGFSTVVGFEPDLETVELLYTSLLVQGTAAMTKAEATARSGGRKRTKTFRQSFLMAYAHRVGERLARVAEAVIPADDLLPVLASRDLAVTDRTDAMFPRTTATRLRGATDPGGWHEGTEAAENTTLAALPRLPQGTRTSK